jgi:hypothetical protein
VLVNFAQSFENYRSITKVDATLFHGKSSLLILTENGLGYNLGDFLKNSSGHPADVLPASAVLLTTATFY